MSAMIDHLGEAKAEEWAKAVRANLARDPKGGDTDQIKGVAAGECEIAITNHYYYARLARSEKPDEKAVAERVGVGSTNQATGGRHGTTRGALGHPREHLRRRGAQERAEPRRRGQIPRVPGERRRAAVLRRRQQRMADRGRRAGGESGPEVVRSVQDRPAERRGARAQPAAVAEAVRPGRLEVDRSRGAASGAARAQDSPPEREQRHKAH